MRLHAAGAENAGDKKSRGKPRPATALPHRGVPGDPQIRIVEKSAQHPGVHEEKRENAAKLIRQGQQHTTAPIKTEPSQQQKHSQPTDGKMQNQGPVVRRLKGKQKIKENADRVRSVAVSVRYQGRSAGSIGIPPRHFARAIRAVDGRLNRNVREELINDVMVRWHSG